MSVIPSIFSKSPRTEAAQPPHVMFGTLRLTSVRSEDTALVVFVGVPVTAGGSVAAWQPIKLATNPVASNVGRALFITILLGNPRY